QRRAAIAGDEARGIESGGGVALPLQDQKANQRLNGGQRDSARLQLVFVVERNVAQRSRAGCGNGHRTSSKNCVSGSRGHRIGAATTVGAIVSPRRFEARI